ncbi:MAG: hypothetical protein H0X43_14085 [Nitrosospira sp.]|nr:hypothetical protein [Nitrosospira sp.]
MNHPSMPDTLAPYSVFRAVGLTLSAAGLILALSASNIAYAQGTPMQDSTSGQSSDDQYKRGETPSGHRYGVIKKGEPHKSDAADTDHSGRNDGMKREAGAGANPIIDRDKRESHEGSGPDPFGRY